VYLKLLLLDPRYVPGFHQPQKGVKELRALVFHRAPTLVSFLKDWSTQFPLFTKLTCFNPRKMKENHMK